MAAAQNIYNSTLRQILQSEKLTGPNFMNWHWNLRIFLRSENKLVYLEQPLIPFPLHVTSQATRDAYDALFDAQNEVACLILGSIPYLLKMKCYLDPLECLGYPMPVSLILNSLNKDNDQFIQNYNMHSMGKMIVELHKDKKKPQGAKGKDKRKTKLAYASKAKISPPPKRNNLEKDSVCHHCNEVDYWRRNFPTYHAELKKRKNASGGLRESRKLKHGALSLNKRPKLTLNSTYLWHCRIGHVNKKRIKKLQCDGNLQPTHDESLEKCISCIYRKMARKPFPHQVERAKDL
ncbi:zinc finger, CCHC-type containing protein [Tanacetum coccineum]|uniref:Zinc finger, CCHC-type containing protein n=1 Tax=Tanacetum coccineum TaxID=301880 RepID=A0ABQ5J4H7_9ASTR